MDREFIQHSPQSIYIGFASAWGAPDKGGALAGDQVGQGLFNFGGAHGDFLSVIPGKRKTTCEGRLGGSKIERSGFVFSVVRSGGYHVLTAFCIALVALDLGVFLFVEEDIREEFVGAGIAQREETKFHKVHL